MSTPGVGVLVSTPDVCELVSTPGVGVQASTLVVGVLVSTPGVGVLVSTHSTQFYSKRQSNAILPFFLPSFVTRTSGVPADLSPGGPVVQ